MTSILRRSRALLLILPLGLSLQECSSKDRVNIREEKAGTVADPHASAGSTAPALPAQPSATLPPKVETHTGATAAHAEAAHGAPAPTAPTAHAPDSGVNADTSLRWLKNGNLRFVRRQFRRDGKSAVDRIRLTKGQKPHAIVLSCSDSRVPPEHVFDQELGEIFVIRVAGEALDTSVVASIEYAVEHLGSHLLVVMGHEACGAVKAAISIPEGQSAGSPSLDALVADIRPRIAPITRKPMVDDVILESSANAKRVAEDLVLRSPILRQHVEKGDLKIVSALYRLGPGSVEFLQ